MSMDRLHRLVKAVDLFAVEAKYHPSCLRSFRTAFANYERRLSTIRKPQDENEINELAAHEKAFSSVLEHIRLTLLKQMELLDLLLYDYCMLTNLNLMGMKIPTIELRSL